MVEVLEKSRLEVGMTLGAVVLDQFSDNLCAFHRLHRLCRFHPTISPTLYFRISFGQILVSSSSNPLYLPLALRRGAYPSPGTVYRA